MHSDEKVFTDALRRVADELGSLLTARIAQVDNDSRAFCRHPDVSSTLAQITEIEATGTIDALRWVESRIEEIRARYGAS
jgi:hypothetical protein